MMVDLEYAKKVLLKAIEEYDPTFSPKKASRIESEIVALTVKDVSDSLLQVRDKLMLNGKILEEHLEEGYYIASLNILKLNAALTFIGIENETAIIASYAKEGLIKQNIANKTVKYLNAIIK